MEDSREPLSEETFTANQLVNMLNYLISSNKLDADITPVQMADGEAICAAYYIDGRIVFTGRFDDKKRLQRAVEILKGTQVENLLIAIAKRPRRFLIAAGDIEHEDIAWADNHDTIEECSIQIESMECDTSDSFTVVDLDTGQILRSTIAMNIRFE